MHIIIFDMRDPTNSIESATKHLQNSIQSFISVKSNLEIYCDELISFISLNEKVTVLFKPMKIKDSILTVGNVLTKLKHVENIDNSISIESLSLNVSSKLVQMYPSKSMEFHLITYFTRNYIHSSNEISDAITDLFNKCVRIEYIYISSIDSSSNELNNVSDMSLYLNQFPNVTFKIIKNDPHSIDSITSSWLSAVIPSIPTSISNQNFEFKGYLTLSHIIGMPFHPYSTNGMFHKGLNKFSILNKIKNSDIDLSLISCIFLLIPLKDDSQINNIETLKQEQQQFHHVIRYLKEIDSSLLCQTVNNVTQLNEYYALLPDSDDLQEALMLRLPSSEQIVRRRLANMECDINQAIKMKLDAVPFTEYNPLKFSSGINNRRNDKSTRKTSRKSPLNVYYD